MKRPKANAGLRGKSVQAVWSGERKGCLKSEIVTMRLSQICIVVGCAFGVEEADGLQVQKKRWLHGHDVCAI